MDITSNYTKQTFQKNQFLSSHKYYIMRHGETLYNAISDQSAKYNPEYADSHLSEKGINQAKSKQDELKKLNIELVYVSPYYRAIETMIYSLENHPNANNIIAYVHPKIAELAGMMHEFVLDIKQTKNDFNKNSKIKVNWSIFDEYIKNTKFGENLFFLNNWNLIDENKKLEISNKLNELYEKGDNKAYKEEASKIVKERYQTKLKFESYKHAYERFIDFKNDVIKRHKDDINKDKIILIISHKLFISIATSSCEFKSDEVKNVSSDCLSLSNCEIAPFIL